MKTIAAIAACLCLSGCAVTFPLGENGQYGELYAGYRPPAVLRSYNVLNSPTLGDK